MKAAPVLFGKLNLIEFFTSTAVAAVVRLATRTTAFWPCWWARFRSPRWRWLLAVPLGLGAAVFISEFCGGKFKETLKILIELLAAIPSIVWGFIGYMVLGPLIIEATGAAGGRESA